MQQDSGHHPSLAWTQRFNVDRDYRMTRVDPATLQVTCERLREQFEVTGVTAAVVHRGALSTAASGTANRDLEQPMRTSTLAQIGSTTKVYTAAMLLQLAALGRVDIDAPVAEVLPEFTLAKDREAALITPRHLMSMTSGLDNGPYADTGRSDDCVERYVRLLNGIPMLFVPGSSYSYSNSSTVVSGLIIERLTGMCWDDALQTLILEPASFTESVSLTEQLPYHHVAVGHESGLDGEVIAQDWTFSRGMGPSGSTLATTAADLARFGQLVLDGGVSSSGTRVLAEPVVRELQSPQVDVPARWFADQWCVGPYRKVWGGIEIFGHGGTTMQSSSTLIWIPKLELTVAVIVNNPSLGYPFAHALFDVLLAEFSIEKPKRPVHDPNATVDARLYAGEYRTFEASYRVAAGETGQLLLVMDSHALGSNGVIETELLPIGDHRFLAVDDRVTSFHNWDLAFSDIQGGQARLLHNGAFAAARISTH